MADPHNRKQNMENTIEKLRNSDYSETNREALMNFKNHLLAEGLSPERICRYMSTFNTLQPDIDFVLREADKQDLIGLVGKINQDLVGRQDYSVWTLAEFKKAVKKFYQWEKGEKEPEITDFFTTYAKKSERPQVDPEQLPTSETVKRLQAEMQNSRDKAFIITLWESGGRISEVLNLKWKDITDKGLYSMLRFRESKTVQRSVPVRDCIKYLETWKQDHPNSGRDEFIFTRLREPEMLSYKGMEGQVQRASKYAGIDCRVNFHAFRKSRATFLASKGLNVYQLMEFFGWEKSETALFYVKLAQSDVEEAFMRLFRQSRLQEFRNESESVQVSHSSQPRQTPRIQSN